MHGDASQIVQACQSKSAFFIQHVLGSALTWQQLAVCNSVDVFRRTAVPAGHGTGKTYLAARLALQRLFAFKGAKVITTAPTWTQVEKLLWRELHVAYNASQYPLGGNLLQTELNVENVTIDYFVGRLKFAVAPPADRIIYVWGEYHLPVAFVSDWHKAKVDFTTTTALSVTVEEALPAEIGCSPTEAFNKA